jgi:hypothetical protein
VIPGKFGKKTHTSYANTYPSNPRNRWVCRKGDKPIMKDIPSKGNNAYSVPHQV